MPQWSYRVTLQPWLFYCWGAFSESYLYHRQLRLNVTLVGLRVVHPKITTLVNFNSKFCLIYRFSIPQRAIETAIVGISLRIESECGKSADVAISRSCWAVGIVMPFAESRNAYEKRNVAVNKYLKNIPNILWNIIFKYKITKKYCVFGFQIPKFQTRCIP